MGIEKVDVVLLSAEVPSCLRYLPRLGALEVGTGAAYVEPRTVCTNSLHGPEAPPLTTGPSTRTHDDPAATWLGPSLWLVLSPGSWDRIERLAYRLHESISPPAFRCCCCCWWMMEH
ncbi:hypothetical protein BGZ63DRAFT_210431 [Mariannaea sp. PMI_226]|nr:hypothetical protein BGZ63DRAFT_210431 [Mariannaea sp. PMI_226]